MQQARWVAAAAVLTKQNSILPRETLDRWESCVQDCDDPAIIRKIVHAAFPELQNAPMEELADVASVLLQKSLNTPSQQNATEYLAPLSVPLATRPGLLIFSGQLVKQWAAARTHDKLHLHRAVEILLWLAEQCAPSPALPCFANLLAEQGDDEKIKQPPSLLLTFLRESNTVFTSVTPRMQIMKLVGLCCETSRTAFEECWAELEQILCRERYDQVLHIAACALFEGIATHCTPTQPYLDDAVLSRGAAAIENGLSCPLPSIQFPAVVAAGKLLMKWKSHVSSSDSSIGKIAAAVTHALAVQQERVGAWQQYQISNSSSGGAPPQSLTLTLSAARQCTAQHILAALQLICTSSSLLLNCLARET